MLKSVILLALAAPSYAVGQNAGPALEIDAAAGRRPISPDIYGINDDANQTLGEALAVPVRRWGGNQATRYHWKLDTYNAASDWFFQNFPFSNNTDQPEHSRFNAVMDAALRAGARTMNTIPMIGWLPKSREQLCSFNVQKYGPQKQTDPWNPRCGNGVRPDDTQITGNDPHDAAALYSMDLQREWVEYLVKRYGRADQGGVGIYSLDNETTIWQFVHRDVHPEYVGYDELTELGIRYAKMIKSVDPSALVSGPVHSGWMAFFYSARDWYSGWRTSPYKYWSNPTDRRAHGDVPLTEYYLQQMREYERRTGKRLLDYLDIHAYVLPSGIAFAEAGDAAKQALRLKSTRALWDAGYQFADPDIAEPPRLIPRMREWVERNYPGTRLAITEYNWGALDHINGALAQAEILGIFGREGLDLATIWGPPKPGEPGAFAFRAYRNYDGHGGQFGETSVSAASEDPDRLSVFAAERSDRALTMVVVNKTEAPLAAPLRWANFVPSGRVEVWQYSAANPGAIERREDAAATPAGLDLTYPASSITVLVAPAHTGRPRPAIAAVRNGASYGPELAPGTIAAIFGQNLGPAVLTPGVVTARAMVDTFASGVRVLFDGRPAPVLYVRADQVGVVVPYSAPNKGHVQVEYNGVRSEAFPVRLAAAAPAIFTANAAGAGPAAAPPARRGDIVTLYATGEGLTVPYGVDGRVAAGLLPQPRQKVTVEVNGIPVDPEYAGAAPGAVAGALQINFKAPPDAPLGEAVPVRLNIGGTLSPAGVTLTIR